MSSVVISAIAFIVIVGIVTYDTIQQNSGPDGDGTILQ